MAIIKNGKIHGRIGNYVYRVMNGKEIIQSYPRSIKMSEGSKAEHQLFSGSSQLSTRIYRQLKDFALNEVDSRLYCNLMACFKRNFFSKRAITNDARFAEWETIGGMERVVMNANIQVDDILSSEPKVSIEEGRCKIQIPEFLPGKEVRRVLDNAAYISYGFTLLHYDFENESVQVTVMYDSERFAIISGFPTREFEVPLSEDEVPVTKGLLVLGFGLRFFASLQSFGYLNSKAFNPCGILGVWYKRK